MELRRVVVIDQETHRHAGCEVSPTTRLVAACAVLANPCLGRGDAAALEELVELSVEVGQLLTERARRALRERRADAYGKAVIVGVDGDLEHGAAMIHVRMGLAMRGVLEGGKALIPGTAKLGGPGATVDVQFSNIVDNYDYDRMDAMEVSVPAAPAAGEIVLVVALGAGGRPNARIRGASREQIAAAAARPG